MRRNHSWTFQFSQKLLSLCLGADLLFDVDTARVSWSPKLARNKGLINPDSTTPFIFILKMIMPKQGTFLSLCSDICKPTTQPANATNLPSNHPRQAMERRAGRHQSAIQSASRRAEAPARPRPPGLPVHAAEAVREEATGVVAPAPATREHAADGRVSDFDDVQRVDACAAARVPTGIRAGARKCGWGHAGADVDANADADADARGRGRRDECGAGAG